MKIIIVLSISFLMIQNAFAQKKSKAPYFSREVTIEDSVTLSLINEYIEKVPQKRVIRLSISAKEGISYRLEAIDAFEIIEANNPFFMLKHKGYYILIDNGVGMMLKGNESFVKYIQKKLKRFLVHSQTIRNLGGGIQEVTTSNYEPPVMSATYSRSGVKVQWNGL